MLHLLKGAQPVEIIIGGIFALMYQVMRSSTIRMIEDQNQWQKCKSNSFWSAAAPDNHFLQIYDRDEDLVQNLFLYASDGFESGGAVVIIAAPEHCDRLNLKLESEGFDLAELSASSRYIVLDANETLQQFMVNGLPDAEYFHQTIGQILMQASGGGRKVRAYGEMVVLLWERGESLATIQLEKLWNDLLEANELILFCAYPKSCFENDASASIMHICCAHSHVLGAASIKEDILYKKVS